MPKPPVCREPQTILGQSGRKYLRPTTASRKPSLSSDSDPRIYETTVKEFIADDKGDFETELNRVKLDWQKRRKDRPDAI
ncbi:MAG: hypothetical protein ACLSG9_08485 [Eubacterium sp.]